MVAMQPSDNYLLALWNILGAHAFVLSLWTMKLFTGNPAISAATLITDLTEPTFGGYAAVALTAPVLAVDGNGNYLLNWGDGLFQPSGPVSPAETATGVALTATISAADKLLMSGFLETPKTFNVATDALQVNLQTMIPNDFVFGGINCQV